MKAHDLANALKTLAHVLKKGPNVEVNEWFEIKKPIRKGINIFSEHKKNDDLPLALSALSSLSRIDKQEWITLIGELGFEIDVRPRDASRDVVGKLLRLLESDPVAREKLGKRVKNRGPSSASPELTRALTSLLSG
jgi:hypothetical protein